MLDQITQNIKPQTPDNPSMLLGTLASGTALLAKALQSFPELAEAAQMIAMLGGNESSTAGYIGTVDFLGTQVEIKDGIGEIEGHKIAVSPDGKIVTDENKKIMGRVENGKFVAVDSNQLDQLKQAGVTK